MPFREWPPQDRDAWEAALRPTESLKPGGVAEAWSPGGRDMIIVGYGHWLGWLDRTGQLQKGTTPAGRVTQARVTSYLEAMRKRLAPLTVQGRIGQLGRALRAMAPDLEWTWLIRTADWLRADASPVREREDRMRDAQTLAELGMSLMHRAEEADDYTPVQRAVLYRDGLMIALLAHRPLQLRSFAAITLDDHLIMRDGKWWLSFAPSEIKTKRALNVPFPEALVNELAQYLAEHRPALTKRRRKTAVERPTTAGLWIAKGGAMMGASAISVQIRSRTQGAFGRPINPHLFRDCVATSNAIDDPNHVRMIVPVFQHTAFGASEQRQSAAIEADEHRCQAKIGKPHRQPS